MIRDAKAVSSSICYLLCKTRLGTIVFKRSFQVLYVIYYVKVWFEEKEKSNTTPRHTWLTLLTAWNKLAYTRTPVSKILDPAAAASFGSKPFNPVDLAPWPRPIPRVLYASTRHESRHAAKENARENRKYGKSWEWDMEYDKTKWIAKTHFGKNKTNTTKPK